MESIKGELKKQWEEITDDDLITVEEDYDKFKGLMQERHATLKTRSANGRTNGTESPKRIQRIGDGRMFGAQVAPQILSFLLLR